MPELSKITTVRIEDFILQQRHANKPVKGCNNQEEPEGMQECEDKSAPEDIIVNRNLDDAPKVRFEEDKAPKQQQSNTAEQEDGPAR